MKILSSSNFDSLVNKVEIETGFPCISSIQESEGRGDGVLG